MSVDFKESTKDDLPLVRHYRRVGFDPTINLGHILTFVGFVVMGFGAWQTLDKRITLTELQNQTEELRAVEANARMVESLKELKNDVKDVQRSVSDVNRTLAIVSQGKK